MKKDAHYYGILGFARACGFKKEAAGKIAYASQFVDDAKINHITIQNPSSDIETKNIEGETSFYNIATAHCYFIFKTFTYNSMINNTTAFHFVPANEGKSFAKRMRCKANSKIAVSILNETIEEDDLIKFGLVLHPYADTFSHQGFSGILSKVNDIKNCRAPKNKIYQLKMKIIKRIKKICTWLNMKKEIIDKLVESASVPYGHGEALVYPDHPSLIWSYEYDYTDEFSEDYKNTDMIDNKKRFRIAFDKIKEYLEEFLSNNPQYRDDKMSYDNFKTLYGTLVSCKPEKFKNWQKILVKEKLFKKDDPQLEYNENKWLENAFENFNEKKFNQRKVENVVLKNDFSNSNWYKFYLALKWYKKRFHYYCSQEGLNIPV